MNWNRKLFLKINTLVGRNRWLDAFGRAGAEWVIIGMGGWYAAISLILHYGNTHLMWLPIFTLAGAELLGLFLSNMIGLIVNEVRPRLSFPEIKILFMPASSWKSFPSDHAMSAFLIFLMAVIFGFPTALGLLPLVIWVCWGRIYSGVHYPGDILGGLILAAFVSVFTIAVLLRFNLV